MRNPIFDRRHIREYLFYGLISCLAYMLPTLYFMYTNKYEHLYYLFVGCAFFMAVMFVYAYKLLYRPYDRKRAVSMLIAGHLATIVGVVFSVIIATICFLFFFPNLFSQMQPDKIVENAPAQVDHSRPSGLLTIILATATFGNFGVGSFISIVTAYAGKVDQRKDTPVSLENQVNRSDASH